MWGGETTRQQLQESIRKLWALNEVPQGPEENPLVNARDLQRHLSVSREQEIASNLAFLSATTDAKQSRQNIVQCLMPEDKTCPMPFLLHWAMTTVYSVIQSCFGSEFY